MDGLVLDAARDGLRAFVVVSAPVMLPLLVTAFVAGVLQAATSINEASLSFFPKLLALVLCLLLFGSLMLRQMVDFTEEIYRQVPQAAQ